MTGPEPLRRFAVPHRARANILESPSILVVQERCGPAKHRKGLKHRKGATKNVLNTAKYDKELEIDLANTAKSDKGLGVIS